MKISTFFGFILQFLFLSSCIPKKSTYDLASSDVISGSVLNYSNIQSAYKSKKSNSNQQTATETDCSQAQVQLYSLNQSGEKETLVSETKVNETGEFEFTGLKEKKIIGVLDKYKLTRYLLEFSCSDITFQRFLTSSSNQKLSEGTTLMSWTTHSNNESSVKDIETKTWDAFYNSLENVDSLSSAFSTLNSNTELKEKFIKTFGIEPESLTDVAPKINSLGGSQELNEGVASTFSIQANHWSPDYNIIYKWKLDSDTLSSSTNLSITPNANSQGIHTLQVFVGQNNGANEIDTTKPFSQKSLEIKINNTIPPIPPNLTLVSLPVTSNLSSQISMATGSLNDGIPYNCRSFSKLSLIIEDYPGLGLAPVLPSSYNIDCTNEIQQIIDFNLVGNDGIKVIKLWAKDSSGQISADSKNILINLDRTLPQINLTSFTNNVLLKGGQTIPITWTSFDINSETHPITIDYTADGINWINMAQDIVNSGNYNWTVPVIDSSLVKIRVKHKDLANNIGIAETIQTITIDSTSPISPVITRTSSNLSNTADLLFDAICTSDISKIFISQNSTTPNENDLNWQNCSTQLNYHFNSGDGLKTIYVFAKDSAGNISTSPNTLSMTLDQTQPTIILNSSLAGIYKGGSQLIIDVSVTELNISNAQNIIFHYSLDGGISWQSLGSLPSLSGPLNATNFIFTTTFPALNTSQFAIKASITDLAGNSNLVQSQVMTIDSLKPTINSFQLASGAVSVAIPNVSVQISASDNLSGLHQMRLSETSVFADDNWQNYSEIAGHFSLSMMSGSKQVYAWVKDQAGNISDSQSTTISLDIGSPPIVSLTSPNNSSLIYSSGDSINIQWSCDSANGLDSLPARIKYTTDEGLNFVTVTSWLPNNISSTTGNYNWTFPSGVSAFRLLVECKSLAGVVASTYSNYFNTSNWSVYAGDPANMSENISVTLALMIKGTPGFQTMAVDQNGNIFISKNSVIIKIDSMTGQVTRFAGDPLGGGSCNLQEGSDPLSSVYNKIGSSQSIFGMNLAKDSIIFGACNKIWKMNTATRDLTVLNSAGSYNGAPWFYSKLGYLYYASSGYLKKLNLNLVNQNPVNIMGNGTCAKVISSANTSALSSSLQGTNSNGCSGETYIFTNSNDTKIWLGCWDGVVGCPNASSIEWNSNDNEFKISSNNVGWTMDWDMGWCSPSSLTDRVWCSSRHSTGQQSFFNTQTQSWTKTSMGKTVFIRYAASPSGMISFSSDNILSAITENSNGSISSGQIGGSDIESYGNGNDLSKLAFSAVEDITYSETLNRLFIDTSVKIRQINITSNLASTTTYSGYLNRLTTNRAGDKFAVIFSCSGNMYLQSLFNGTSFTSGNLLMNRNNCGTSTYDTTYPLADSSASSLKVNWIIDYNRRPLHHSNGKFYFFTMDGSNNNALLYSSNSTTLNIIAGTTGTNGYNSAHHGQNANAATLTNVRAIYEIPSGKPNAGDLLIVDNNRLRMVTITTESAQPKIYDLISFALATNYSANSNSFIDVVYDFNSEMLDNMSQAIPGTGAFYYSTSTNEIHKFSTTAITNNLPSAATDIKYNFSGTSLTGNTRLALIPSGLLITQPTKNRILIVPP